ncbi:MAG: membrane protein [marine bacterium B5-7]|nr:MAG: membrane protein [marine bacterium B5-7]
MTERKTVYALLTTVTIWASAFVGVRAGLHSYHPGSMALLRYLVASLCMAFLFFRRPQRATVTVRDWVNIFILGILGFGVYNIALNYGEISVPAGIASFIVCQIPVMTTILAVYFLGERLPWLAWVGIVISIAGITVIALGEKEGLHFDKGVWYTLIAAASGSLYAAFQKPLLKRIHPIEFTTYAIWAGTISLLMYTPEMLHDIPRASLHDTIWVIYMGIFPGAIAYALWTYSLSKLPASIASTYLYLMPLIAVVMGYIMLNEMPNRMSLIGGVIALVGAMVVNLRKRK